MDVREKLIPMKRFEKVTEPEGLDFFQIFEDGDGVKHIHLLGYCSEQGDAWVNVEATFIIVPLAEFVKNVKKKTLDYTDALYQEANRHRESVSSEEMTNIINTYFNGCPPDYYLNFRDITEDTPCGKYVFLYAWAELFNLAR